MHEQSEQVTGLQAPPPPPLTLPLPQLVASAGEYPVRPAGGPPLCCTGMVQSFAGAAAYGAPAARGESLGIPQNQPLYSIVGPSFGGDGIRSFDLPDLRGRSAIGGTIIGEETQQALTMTWMVAARPGGALVGALGLFAANWVPDGWLAADGSMFSAADYPALMELFGTIYGGEGPFFKLPDLTGATPVGTGQGPGIPPVALGQQVAGAVPGLGLTGLICIDGQVPPADGDGGFPPAAPFLGQVIAFAGAAPPPGWALADGSLLPIAANQPLFQLIGTTYGGDGEVSFALPDLRGRQVVGS